MTCEIVNHREMNIENESPSTIYLPAAPEDKNMVSGKYPPQRMRSEDVDSCNILIRSEDRTWGTDYNFQVDLITTSAHIRKMQLSRCGLPLIPQINEKNRTVSITHTDGNVTFDLIEGFYSVQGLVNMMQSEFQAAWVSLDATNSVTISYDIERRSITISDDNLETWYMHTECIFNRYARNVVRFDTLPGGSPIPGISSYESLSLGMIYSRFVILSSRRMIEDQKTFSIISGIGPKDIVSIIDLASAYQSEQFNVSSSFPGTDQVIDCLESSPRINMLNRTKSLKVIDFQLSDEFGFNLSELNTASYRFEYPIFLSFQCYL